MEKVKVDLFYNDGFGDFDIQKEFGKNLKNYDRIVSWFIRGEYNGISLFSYDFSKICDLLIQKKFIKDDLNIKKVVEDFVETLLNIWCEGWEDFNNKDFFMEELKKMVKENEIETYEKLYDLGVESESDYLKISGLDLEFEINYYDGEE